MVLAGLGWAGFFSLGGWLWCVGGLSGLWLGLVLSAARSLATGEVAGLAVHVLYLPGWTAVHVRCACCSVPRL
jgi:hypothetical protein